MEHLQIKRRIVCENTDRIIMDMESVVHGLDNDRLVFIRDDPVEACGRHLGTKRCSDKIHSGKRFATSLTSCALA